MIKVFRNIRQKLVEQNKVRNYVLYAVGEIFLVVIGILIALQVNNWNEGRKQNIEKDLIMQSLVTDLKMDTLVIHKTLNSLQHDTTEVVGFIKRMSSSGVTIDTLIQIARFEYNPKINVAVAFNDNTFKSLLSSGDLNILDKWMQDEILQLNALHQENVSRTELNVGAYVNQVISYERMYPLGDYGNINPNSILANAIWDEAQFEELGRFLNALISIRYITDMYAINQLKTIEKKTEEILRRINSSENKN
ncbi:hypothetical protein C7S20_08945 [Christiangramia fulva]|uniref:Uncharacterized protein n=1 Tax=Christiangramia fulva TaxID=2126553 RepID=A0A2R3Z530_9FLAO|nr:DUF6090 family protein [Christiangramia fulva]AVR45386.1 hypothetical protein C7S20_08945 [Christiangramia fulva]